MWLGVLLLVIGVGVALYVALRRPSPDAVPPPLAREFRELSTIVAGKALPDARSLTREQLDLMLYDSAGHGSPGMVGWLLSQGANPRANMKDRGASYGDRSALQEAARRGRCESEIALIKAIGDRARESASGSPEQKALVVAEQVAIYVNESDSHRISPLHDAVEGGKRECVAALLAAGARVDVIDDHGVTPLDMAQERQFNHLVPMLTDAQDKQEAGNGIAAAGTGAPASGDRKKDADAKRELAATPPPPVIAGGARTVDGWQTLGGLAGMFRVDLDRSGTMPNGQGRMRIVAEQNGHIAGKGWTFEYDCAGRTLHMLTTGDWGDDGMINEKSASTENENARKEDATSQVVINALCGVAFDTGHALDTPAGWKSLGAVGANKLEVLSRTVTRSKAQYRLGSYGAGGFSGVGFISEVDCDGHRMRSLREQVWKDGAMTQDEAAIANTWSSTERSDGARLVYGAICPTR